MYLWEDIINVHPYGNENVCWKAVEATGRRECTVHWSNFSLPGKRRFPPGIRAYLFHESFHPFFRNQEWWRWISQVDRGVPDIPCACWRHSSGPGKTIPWPPMNYMIKTAETVLPCSVIINFSRTALCWIIRVLIDYITKQLKRHCGKRICHALRWRTVPLYTARFRCQKSHYNILLLRFRFEISTAWFYLQAKQPGHILHMYMAPAVFSLSVLCSVARITTCINRNPVCRF